MCNTATRRNFLRCTSLGGLTTAIGLATGGLGSPLRTQTPAKLAAGSKLKTSLNAYSFSKLLNDYNKGNGPGPSLLELVDYCARHDFDGFDPTGYFFPGYPNVPADGYVNQLKRRTFNTGIGISGTGVRNNFTTADKTVRAAGVQHIKQWVEVAARLGAAPVLRVFADTQMKAQTWQTVAPGCTRNEVEEWIADSVRECAEHGEKYGVIIGVQNHGDFLKTSDDHLKLIKRVDSDWCGPIVDTGYYKSDDPYQDMAAVAPFAVNWQIKESPIGAGSEVRTDMGKLLTLIRLSGYRGYLPIETLSASGKEYDPFDVVPKFLAELRQAMDATAPISQRLVVEEPPLPARPAATNAATPNPATPNPTDSRPPRKPANKKKNNLPDNR